MTWRCVTLRNISPRHSETRKDRNFDLPSVVSDPWALNVNSDGPFRPSPLSLLLKGTTALYGRRTRGSTGWISPQLLDQAVVQKYATPAPLTPRKSIMGSPPYYIGERDHSWLSQAHLLPPRADITALHTAHIIKTFFRSVIPYICLLANFTVVEEKYSKLRRRFLFPSPLDTAPASPSACEMVSSSLLGQGCRDEQLSRKN